MMTGLPYQPYLLVSAPIGQEDLRERLVDWFGSLPTPMDLEVLGTERGTQIWAFAPRAFEGAASSFAALTQHAFHWTTAVDAPPPPSTVGIVTTTALLPQVFAQGEDPFLVWASTLRDAARRHGFPIGLRVMLFDADPQTQQELRALVAYNYGTRSGVSPDEPNPWGLRLAMYKALVLAGVAVTGVSIAASLVGWLPPTIGLAAGAAGFLSFLAGAIGTRRWMEVRNIPKDVMVEFTQTPLFRAAFAFTAYTDDLVAAEEAIRGLAARVPVLSGIQKVVVTTGSGMRRVAASSHVPLPASALTRLFTPPQRGDPASIMDPDTTADVPTPPPTPGMKRGRYEVGLSAATLERVRITPDGHGLIVGGSRSGKSSLAARLLISLLEDDDPPGLVVIDPHESLADAFLDHITQLPEPKRRQVIRRLRVISPDQEEIVPLNLLSLPDYTWAANALIQSGQRIWTDYWGPRMQASLNALFNLGQAHNMAVPDDQRLSLFHLPFLAFSTEQRRSMLQYLPPERRVIALNLDALLGQYGSEGRPWQIGWTTEVVSPVVSKLMALELSPWLTMSMAHPRFVDLSKAIRERSWFILRTPTGIMGKEGARLLTAIFYNVWESMFRRIASARDPIPYLVIVDEMQEIAMGMELESLLSEGAKFGATVVGLTQSLHMLMHEEKFRPVVQALKANTSFQAFFSPDPDDIRDIRTILSADVRYPNMTLDLPTLHCWLRMRINGRWQPPTVIRVPHIPASDPDRVRALIREVIDAHPEFYAHPTISADALVNAMLHLVPPQVQTLLGRLLDDEDVEDWNGAPPPDAPPPGTEQDRRMKRLGL